MKFLYWGGVRSLTIRSFYLMFRLRKCGFGLTVRKGARINAPHWVTMGERCVLNQYASIHLNQIDAKITPSCVIGTNVRIGAYTSIGCSNEIIIEDNVGIAPYVHITDRNHGFEDVSIPIYRQPATSPGKVIIGADSWLGYGVQVMPNVKIGKHCVIAAGSVVTKDVPCFCVAAGVPAKIIKRYNFETSAWEKICAK